MVVVEVRQRTLGSDHRIVEVRRRGGGGGEGGAGVDIKSNNPHLAGGEYIKIYSGYIKIHKNVSE